MHNLSSWGVAAGAHALGGLAAATTAVVCRLGGVCGFVRGVFQRGVVDETVSTVRVTAPVGVRRGGLGVRDVHSAGGLGERQPREIIAAIESPRVLPG